MTRSLFRSKLAYLAAILLATQLALLGMDAVAGSPVNQLVTGTVAVLAAFVLLRVVQQRDQARAELARLRHPDHPVIDTWAAIADPDIPNGVIERLIGRQAARRDGRTPHPVPEDDKQWLARHVVNSDHPLLRRQS